MGRVNATRSARSGLYVSSRDHRAVGYRVPKEWAALSESQRGVGSLAAFKRGSRVGFLAGPLSVAWLGVGYVHVTCDDG